jgi:hypothetical protein
MGEITDIIAIMILANLALSLLDLVTSECRRRPATGGYPWTAIAATIQERNDIIAAAGHGRNQVPPSHLSTLFASMNAPTATDWAHIGTIDVSPTDVRPNVVYSCPLYERVLPSGNLQWRFWDDTTEEWIYTRPRPTCYATIVN